MSDTEETPLLDDQPELDAQQDQSGQVDGGTGDAGDQTAEGAISALGLGPLGSFLGTWATLIGQWLFLGLMAPVPMVFFAAIAMMKARPSWSFEHRLAFCILPFVLAGCVESLHYIVLCPYRIRLGLVKNIFWRWWQQASQDGTPLPSTTEHCTNMENVGITIATTVVQVLAWACFPLRWWLQNDCHHVYKLMSMCGIMPPRAEKRKVNNESARELDRRRSERSESIPLTFIQRGGAEQASTTGVEILRAGSNSAQTVHQRRRQAKEGEVTLEGAHAALCAVIPDPAERRGDSESDPDYRERLTLLLGICQKVNTGIRHFSEGVDFPKAPYAIPDLYVEVQRQRNELLPSDLVSDYTLPEEHPSQRKVRLEQALSQMLQSSAFRLDDDIFVYCSEEYVRVLRHTSLPKHRLSILQALFNALQFTLQHWVKLHYVAFEYSDALHQADKAINAQEVLVTTCNLLLPSSEERFKDMYFFFTLDRLIELTRKTDERTELLSFINHAVSVIVKRHATGSCMTHGQAGRLLESISTLASYAAWTSGEDTAQVATWKRELRRVDQEEKASSYRKSDQTDHMHGTMTRRRQRRQADQDDPDDSEDM